MTVELAGAQRFVRSQAARGAGFGLLRAVAIAAGIGWSLAFVGLGLAYRLQMYGDGSIFSYAVAVQDAWAIHWHNIAGRVFVYLFCLAPAEAYVGVTQDAGGGVALYGILFFGAQLFGLAATFAADRSGNRAIFSYACASTACLCPLVFGFPTEMWLAHAMFWPTLALAHYGRDGIAGFLAVLSSMLALIFTHEGAVVLAVVIVMTLVLRGYRDAAFVRAATALTLVIAVWFAVKMLFRPDAYISAILTSAELNFFDPRTFTHSVFGLEAVALAVYGALLLALRRLGVARAAVCSAFIVVVALAGYWLLFDPPLHTENRYYLRTALVLAMPVLGALAALHALGAAGSLRLPVAGLSRMFASLSSAEVGRAAAIGLLILTLVNAVETARFVVAWEAYTAAIRDLAMGKASDPQLGDPSFVSSDRIDVVLAPLSWSSTTPFLAVMVAPKFKPARLVVDPTANYFWLPCNLATFDALATRAIPVESRRMIRLHACLHR